MNTENLDHGAHRSSMSKDGMTLSDNLRKLACDGQLVARNASPRLMLLAVKTSVDRSPLPGEELSDWAYRLGRGGAISLV